MSFNMPFDMPLEDTPILFEDSPALFEDSPALFEDSPALFEDTPVLFEDTPVLFEDEPLFISETANAVVNQTGQSSFVDIPGLPSLRDTSPVLDEPLYSETIEAMYTTSGSMGFAGYQKIPFFVNQTDQSSFVDIPGLPSSQDTSHMLDDTKSKMSPTKWGVGAVKCFMTAEYVHHLVCCLLNVPGHEWLHAQEKHMITKEYIVDEDQHLCNIKGQKIIVREQIHELLVFLHLMANHQGRDASIDMLRIHYPEISRKGITKALMSKWINLLCPFCMSKPKQLGPKTKKAQSSKPAAKKMTSPKKNRIVKKQSTTAVRKAIPEHVLVSEMAAQNIAPFEYEAAEASGNSSNTSKAANYQQYLQAQYANPLAYGHEENSADSFEFLVDCNGHASTEPIVNNDSPAYGHGGNSGNSSNMMDTVDHETSSRRNDIDAWLGKLFPDQRLTHS